MTPWELDTNLFKLLLTTPMVKDRLPVNAVLVGPKGSGKSTMLERFADWPTAYTLGDATMTTVLDTLSEPQYARVRTMIFPELNRLLSRDWRTASQAIAALTQAMTGELHVDARGAHRRDMSGRVIQVVTAVTNERFGAHIVFLEDTGFLSRSIVVQTQESEEERRRVLSAIAADDQTDLSPVPFPFTTADPIAVHVPGEMGRRIVLLFESFGMDVEDYRRIVQQMKTLASASAILDRRETVTAYDVERVLGSHFLHHLAGGIQYRLNERLKAKARGHFQ